MRSLLFLTQKQIDWLHQKVIEEFGRTYGLRDHGLLTSAVKHPHLHYHYTRCDLFEMLLRMLTILHKLRHTLMEKNVLPLQLHYCF